MTVTMLADLIQWTISSVCSPVPQQHSFLGALHKPINLIIKYFTSSKHKNYVKSAAFPEWCQTITGHSYAKQNSFDYSAKKHKSQIHERTPIA